MNYKYAVVTGASSGIGYEYAAQLAARGYGVVLVSNREAENRVTAERIATEYRVPTHAYCVDLTADGAAEQLWRWTVERGLEIEVLVCNAGILLFGWMVTMSPEKLQNIVTLHCTTTTLLCRYFGAAMCERKRGFILLMSSSTAWLPFPSIAAYAATKAYIRSLSRSLHAELWAKGVRVTAVFPGAVDTPLYQLSDKMRRRLIFWGVMSTPQFVARKGLTALFKGRCRSIPGGFNKFSLFASRLIPPCVIRALLRIPAVKRLLG